MKYNPKIVAAFWRELGIPPAQAEYQFHVARQWRFDFAWPAAKLALEVQGGIWSGGRHTRGAALLMEWEKLNTAASLGWRILYCQPADLTTVATARIIKMSLNLKS